MMKSAVALFVFRRPDCTLRVWEEIRRAQPPILLIVADGPRSEHEKRDCDATRAITDQVDWPCDVRRNYSPENLGCRMRMVSGLNWVFKEVEEAIILEDDCLPEPSFFRFCDELLERYRFDERVMHISGDNFQNKMGCGGASYYFSKYAHIWGWASWRRAWASYDVDMHSWSSLGQEVLDKWCLNRIEKHYWGTMFRGAAEGRLTTWDYAWLYTCWEKGGFSILPGVNLVANIGFGAKSTHTNHENSPFSDMATKKMSFPLKHPAILKVEARADRYTFRTMYVCEESVVRRIWRFGVRMLRGKPAPQ